MSILQEYEEIRKQLGEKKFKEIERYLDFHPDKLLCDLYYVESEWKTFEKWFEETEDVVKNNEPIIFVIENYKGLAEHNFFGTKKEIAETLGVSDRNFEEIIGNDYYARPNVSYQIMICHSAEFLAECLSGKHNDDLEDMISRNYPELDEYDGSYDDWYWDNDISRCGKKAIEIAKEYALSCSNPVIKQIILKSLDDSSNKGKEETNMEIKIYLRDLNGKKECLQFDNDSAFLAFNWDDYDDENYQILMVVYDGVCAYSALCGEAICFEDLMGFFA